MERNRKAVCFVVGLLALLTAVTGFAAEATRNKAKYSDLYNCSYPRTPAYGLGITSSTCLVIAQIVITAAGRCTCCCTRGPHQSNPHWTLALVCYVVSWFGTVVAYLVFIVGASFNEAYDSSRDYYPGICYTMKSGAFAGAAVLSLVSLGLGIAYYLILSSEKKSVPIAQGGGIAMGQGQPQVNRPRNGQDPVFVHEDTYARRQLV